MNSSIARDLLVFDDSKRIVTNLLARENISTQIVDGAPTASFDPLTRVLTIPNWATLTVDQIDLLIAHEVGHALYTDTSVYEKIAKDKRALFTYLNVVEDARIERKMKNAFPGLARTFYTGYHQFHTDGPIFKGDRTHLENPKDGSRKAIADMKLIDRINLYYKIGAFVNVPFSDAERVFIRRIDTCGSMDQAIAIARDLYNLAKESETKTPQTPAPEQKAAGKGQKSQAQSAQSDEQDGDDSEGGNESSDGDGDSKDAGDESDSDGDAQGDGDQSESAGDDSKDGRDGDSDGAGEKADENETESKGSAAGDADGDESDATDEESDQTAKTNQPGQGAGAGNQSGEPEEAETVADAAAALQKLAEQTAGVAQIRHLLLAPVSERVLAGRIVSAETWTTAVDTKLGALATVIGDKVEAAWDRRFLSTATHMALEFERRKTAKNLQNVKVAKTGRLNLTKLSQYKFTEDLFLRSMTVPTGKSHGVVMVIDGSGSMAGCFANVLDQVLLFAKFASQVNIPFEAYMFTDQESSYTGYSYSSQSLPVDDQTINSITVSQTGRLVGLINTGLGKRALKRQVRAVLALQVQFLGVEYDQNGYGPPVYGKSAGLNDMEGQACLNLPYSNLGGTPLWTGMLLGERMLAKMKSTYHLDKTTFIVVSDGQDGNKLQVVTQQAGIRTGRVSKIMRSISETAVVVRDTVTKKNFVQVAQTTDYRGNTVCSLPENAILTAMMRGRCICTCSPAASAAGAVTATTARTVTRLTA
jgi:hypothetical protein